jgi:polyhydroxyalkanoate synthesis repressor PhaR
MANLIAGRRPHVQIIKKYANRKLYHTNRKQYITLDGIAALIQAGEHIQVVDNESGADITPSILAQVVAQTRGRGGLLPTHVLTDLIQAGGETIAGMRRSIWDTLGGAAVVDAEIKRRLDRLEDDGALDAEEAERMRRLLLRAEPEADTAPEGHMPSRADLAQLSAQVDSLTAVVEQLLAERNSPAAASESPLSSPKQGGE